MRIDLIDVHRNEDSRGWYSDAPLAPDDVAPVFEDRWYSLLLADYDGTKTYCVKIGDETQKLQVHEFSNTLEFSKGVYFESASGPTDLVLCETSEDGKEDRVVFRTTLYVVPSKIGWGNYKSMVQDLQAVCHALVTDIRGKSSKAVGRGRGLGRAWRTHEEELDAVCGAIRRLRPLVREIRRSPKTSMQTVYGFARVDGCRSPKGVGTMMKRGIDPRQDTGSRRCRIGRVAESRDIAEHRLLKAFLKLVLMRVANCRAGLASEVRRLEAEGKYRTRTSRAGEQSLFESEDLPRIRRYRERDELAANVQGWLEAELADEFWADVREEVFSPESTQFAENEYYLQSADIILKYLRDTSHWGGTFASGMMTKKSSRMYEQWVLVQLVAAFERAGVAMTSWDEIMARSVDRQFGFDLGRNTQFRAQLSPGYELVIRYEPWIVPKEDRAQHPEETLCHFGKSSARWNPDIVIELVGVSGSARKTVYAIALDAKYSKRPTVEMRNNILKYARIRTTDGRYGRRVARQVWLVYPGLENRRRPFFIDDEAMCFSSASGVMYRDTNDTVEPAEQVFGEIVAIPGERSDGEETPTDIGVSPRDVFVDFASGTLAYLRSLADGRG